MSAELLIPRAFNGPPTSGHGGYTAGLIATALGHDGPVAVSLRMPPPLEEPMTVARTAVGVEVSCAAGPVASAGPTTIALPPPPAVDVERAAAAAVDGDTLLGTHPFPTCYGCGPERAPGDGLRLFPGAVADVWACAWTPQPGHAGADGLVDPVFVWTALDCPSATPTGMMSTERAIVLARFAMVIEAPVPLDATYAIVSALDRIEGRKNFTTIALYDAAGTRLAHGETLWIELQQKENR